MSFKKYIALPLVIFLFSAPVLYGQRRSGPTGSVGGKIISTEKNEAVGFATVQLKGTTYGSATDERGVYRLSAPPGTYTLTVSAIGYKTVEKEVRLTASERTTLDLSLSPAVIDVGEVTVSASMVGRVRESSYNAVAIDTKALQNTTMSLSDALARAPGMKIRESGGVGSDMQLMLDGFTGRHVKVFIDGVPQEGVGRSFGLNNIPVGYAERIEVYKGVVPVGFGTDAIGGIINIVTRRQDPSHGRNRWFIDASYSFGSFNTHKSYVNFGQTLKNGFTYEINAFQNYSDNSYQVDAKVKQFLEGGYTKTPNTLHRVRRFHDNYHNEAVVGKIGVVGKRWADRLMFGFTYSRMYKETQNGVIQDVVFGGIYRRGYSLMPSVEYVKRDLGVRGLNLRMTANYNRDVTDLVDTCRYEFNWLGEKRLRTSPGEQSYQHNRQYNDNWNATATIDYRIGRMHTFTLNHQIGSFHRNGKSMLTGNSTQGAIPNRNRKNVSGFSYRLMPSGRWNISVFGKYYHQYAAGSVAQTQAQDSYTKIERSQGHFGYGVSGTWFSRWGLQAKVSYERACRMPTDGEMFGVGDNLEIGNFELKPEQSDNVNFSLSYEKNFGAHSLYLEGGLIFRDTRDYISRVVNDGSGGKSNGQSINHGHVRTDGYNFGLRYGFSKWLSIGGNFTQTNVRNRERRTTNGNEDLTYGVRLPNTPYQYANMDVAFYWHDLGKKGNLLTITYDNMYLHSFSKYWENLGDKDSQFIVPAQFSHNLTISYSIHHGRYNLSFECRNFTDEKLYDNFSLQKAGRAFYGKLRIYFHSGQQRKRHNH